MRRISSSDLKSAALASLGLDPDVFDLESAEAMAALVRRTASMVCPCPPRMLVNEIRRALRGLVSDETDKVELALESVLAYGDLQELRDRDPEARRSSTRLIYVAPPAYVVRESGTTLLVGLAPDGASLLPAHLEEHTEVVGHVRRLPVLDADDRVLLQELGLRELTIEEWSGAPVQRGAAEHLSLLEEELEEAPASGEVPGLRVLDPSRPVRFYKGRWAEAGSLSGRFVGRRPQAYGADLWCYVELDNSGALRFVDFPVEEESYRGCDEAWRLQAAIDAVRGAAQQYRLRRNEDDDTFAIDLFSPLPAWVTRRWDAMGFPVPPRKCLFSYEFPCAELAEELDFLQDDLWLVQWSSEA